MGGGTVSGLVRGSRLVLKSCGSPTRGRAEGRERWEGREKRPRDGRVGGGEAFAGWRCGEGSACTEETNRCWGRGQEKKFRGPGRGGSREPEQVVVRAQARGLALSRRPEVLASRSHDLPSCPWRAQRERQLRVHIRASSAGGCDQIQRKVTPVPPRRCGHRDDSPTFSPVLDLRARREFFQPWP